MRSLVMLVMVVCVSVSMATTTSISPSKSTVYGNSITLADGTSGVVAAATYSAVSTVTSEFYAVDAQVENATTWNDADYPGIQLTGTGWADGAITYKFVAPAGETFTGGTISIAGADVSSAEVEDMYLWTYDTYANNGGWGALVPDTGTVYGYQAVTMEIGNWTKEYSIAIPTGVSEFYFSAQATKDYATVLVGPVSAYQVTTIPEPATMTLLALGGIFLARKRKSA